MIAAIGLLVWRCRGEVIVEERGAVTTGKLERLVVDAPREPNLTVRVVGIGQSRATVTVRAQQQSVGGSERSPMQLAVTDAAGSTAFAIPRGRYTVAVGARGFLPGTATAVVGSTAVAIEISLERGGIVLTGVVTDVGGGPIANARVDATRRSGATAFGTVAAITDATGRYELSLARGAYGVEASHDEYVASSAYIEVREQLDQDFQLVPGGSIRGRVVSDAGTPIADARVEAPRGSIAITDEDGVFELRRLRAGINRLDVSARRFRSVNPTEVPVALGEHVRGVTLVVAPAFVISGRTMTNGEPVPDAVVAAYGLDRYTTHDEARGDGDGRFDLTVAAGPYLLMVDDDTVSARSEQGTRIDVVDRDVSGVVVELDPGHRVTGRVDPPMAISILPCGGLSRGERREDRGVHVRSPSRGQLHATRRL